VWRPSGARNTETGCTLAGLIAEVQRDPNLAEIWRERFVAQAMAQHYVTIEHALGRGEISADIDSGVMLNRVLGRDGWLLPVIEDCGFRPMPESHGSWSTRLRDR
jgi:hypothetical protein